MTDLTVVVVLRLIIRLVGRKRSAPEERLRCCLQLTEQPCDHILMFVMRELDDELSWNYRIAKRKTNIITRRHAGVADGTDHRPRTFEKLRAVAADTGLMAGVIRYVRKASYLFPVFRRCLVASIAV